jgi:hypothetical protein
LAGLIQGALILRRVPRQFHNFPYAEQSLAADGGISSFSSHLFQLGLNADRAPQVKAAVRRFAFLAERSSSDR